MPRWWGSGALGAESEAAKAEPGTQYKSRLHKIDNLQAAHTYCNKRKGNTPDVDKWRHPAMPPPAARWRVAAGSISARARSNPRSRQTFCASSLLRCDGK